MPRADQTPEVKVKQNAGSPDQLPRGAAQELNEGLAAVPDQEDPIVPVGEGELEAAMPGDFEAEFTPETEDEDIIAGPTGRPDESQVVGAIAGRATRPRNLETWLPALDEAAQALDASPQIRALARLVHYHLER